MKLPWTLITKNNAELPFKSFKLLVDYAEDLISDSDLLQEKMKEKPKDLTLRESRKWHYAYRITDMEASNLKVRFEVNGDPFSALKEEIYDATYEDDYPMYDIEYIDDKGERRGELSTSVRRVPYLKNQGYEIIEVNTTFEDEYPFYSALLKTMLINKNKKSRDSDKRGKNPNSLRNLKQNRRKDQIV